jgi:hypothetical protein
VKSANKRNVAISVHHSCFSRVVAGISLGQLKEKFRHNDTGIVAPPAKERRSMRQLKAAKGQERSTAVPIDAQLSDSGSPHDLWLVVCGFCASLVDSNV